MDIVLGRTQRESDMHRTRLMLTLCLTAALIAVGVATMTSRAAERECRYFNETGHWVCGDFLAFFEGRGGVELFGFPLTEAFDDPTHDGLRVQYFQRARMEWHPANRAPYDVQLGLLVDELGYSFPPAQPEEIPSSNGPLHHYFPTTGHVVSYAFLDYFREHGGLDIFGYPRSEFMYESGHIIQYFQRARLVWHPESPSGPQMRPANLGEVYIEEFGLPGAFDEPVPPSATPSGSASGASSCGVSGATCEPVVTKLRVRASVRFAVTGQRGRQTLFVYVADQQQRPVKGASVTATVRYPSRRQTLELEPTHEGGFTKGTFEILSTPPGRRVVIDVTTTYQGVRGTTQMFFLPWW